MARPCSTICLPVGQDDYTRLIDHPRRFRSWLDHAFRAHPELFPKGFATGYRLKDQRTSRKTGLRLRRVRLKATGEAFSVRPSFAQVEKLCGRAREYGQAYKHPGGHRTSAMLDRLMRSMSRYFEDAQHLHGSAEACGRHCRAWALLYNFRPWHPATARANGGWRCPAERLNQHRYHDDWLQNLLVSASLGGYRC